MPAVLKPSMEVDLNQTRDPILAWEGKDNNTPYRIVIVFHESRGEPLYFLEKLTGESCMGDQLWQKVEIAPTFPKIIVKALADMAAKWS